MTHTSRQPMPPTAARITMLEAENEALRRRVTQLESDLAAARGEVGPKLTFVSKPRT